jgi:ferredoxin-NADP reductase
VGQKRSTTLFYCNNTAAEIAYQETFANLTTKLPLSVVHVLAKEQLAGFESGFLTREIIEKHLPNYQTVDWYISGPPGMVNAYGKMLHEMGVAKSNIKEDFFPGLA